MKDKIIGLLKSLSIVLFFFASQLLGMFLVFITKIKINEDWLYNIVDIIDSEGIMSTTYMKGISDLIYSSLIISDIILAAGIVFIIIKRKEKVIKPVPKRRILLLTSMAIVLNLSVSLLVEKLPPMSISEDYGEIMSFVTGGNFGLVLLTSGILAPIIEELIFRYVIIGFYKDSAKTGIIISSVLFGLAHMNVIQSSYAFVLGLILGYVYVSSNKNLIESILVHLVINSTSVVYEYANDWERVALLGIAFLTTLYLAFRVIKKESVLPDTNIKQHLTITEDNNGISE